MTKHVKINDLYEQRSVLMDSMKEAVNDGEKFDTLQRELADLDKRIGRQKALDDADRAAPGIPLSGDAKLTSEIRSKYSLSKAVLYAAGVPGIDAGYEIEIGQELRSTGRQTFKGFAIPIIALEQRVMTASGAGADLIANQLRDDLYTSALTEQTIAKRLGARTMSNLVGNQIIPMEASAPNVQWIADNSALTALDAAFGHITMTPHTVGALTEISRQTLLQTTPAMDEIIKGQMQRDIALEIDRVALNGGGANQPTGVLANSGITHISAPSSIYEGVIDIQTAARKANVGALSVVTTPDIEAIALKARDEDNRPFGLSTVFADIPRRSRTLCRPILVRLHPR